MAKSRTLSRPKLTWVKESARKKETMNLLEEIIKHKSLSATNEAFVHELDRAYARISSRQEKLHAKLLAKVAKAAGIDLEVLENEHEKGNELIRKIAKKQHSKLNRSRPEFKRRLIQARKEVERIVENQHLFPSVPLCTNPTAVQLIIPPKRVFPDLLFEADVYEKQGTGFVQTGYQGNIWRHELKTDSEEVDPCEHDLQAKVYFIFFHTPRLTSAIHIRPAFNTEGHIYLNAGSSCTIRNTCSYQLKARLFAIQQYGNNGLTWYESSNSYGDLVKEFVSNGSSFTDDPSIELNENINSLPMQVVKDKEMKIFFEVESTLKASGTSFQGTVDFGNEDLQNILKWIIIDYQV